MTLTLMDWFCGAGGSSQGAHAVPGVEVSRAANHWRLAIESHASNFAETDHWCGDIREAPVERWPVCEIFWASPECPQWSNARGKRRDFTTTGQAELFGEERDEEVERSRALMEEVPLYLRGVIERGGRVLAGVVENVIDVRAWDQWDRWLGEIRVIGYRTRTIAYNSMHAHPALTPRAPQSRDRLYVAYWHTSLGRDPDWDKWLRPAAWCPTCDDVVRAVQVFKMPGRDMGRYRMQYVYRCPNVACRSAVVEPGVLPAAAAIDWTIPGQRIGDRDKPLAPKTLARIKAGLEKYVRPLLVPVEGREGKEALPADQPLRTQTARNETGLAWLPFIAELRGGGSDARSVAEALATVTASGNHHGLVVPPGFVMRNNGSLGDGGEHCTGFDEPLRTLTAAGHQSVVTWHDLAPYGVVPAPAVDIEDVLFRMLEPHEIGAAMAFRDGYVVVGNKRQKVRQYGNAVTPPVAEILVSALVEAITGEDLEAAS